MDLDYLEIGQNIRHYRQKRGIRQKELAEYIHVSDQHISHIENGHTKLSLITLVAIANTLNVDCNTLLGSTLYNAMWLSLLISQRKSPDYGIYQRI